MTLGNPRGGIGYAPEFQSSALPWVTSSVAPSAGSPARFDFPKVTRFLAVSNLGATTDKISFGFTWAGVVSSSNKYELLAGQSVVLELRVRSLWVQSESGTPVFSLCAGLTTIDAREMPTLTGSYSDGTSWPGVG